MPLTQQKILIVAIIWMMMLAGCSVTLQDTRTERPQMWSARTSDFVTNGLTLSGSKNGAQAITEHLSLRQKIGQLVMVGFEGDSAPQDLTTFVGGYQVGGLILYPRNIRDTAQLKRLVDYGNSLTRTSGVVLKLPLLWCLIEEGGALQRLPSDLGSFASAADIGAQNEPSQAREYGQRLGTVFGNVGINTMLGPVFDLRGVNSVIGERAFAADPETVSVLASEIMLGLRENGVVSIAKHFPGIGDATSPARGFANSEADYARLLSRELLPFMTAIENGCEMIQVSHTMYPALDANRPASLSSVILQELLREELGFEGIILSDDLNSASLTAYYSPGAAAVQAIQAGCDMVLVCHSRSDQEQVLDALYQACSTGAISEERLNESVAKVVALKQKYLMWP